MTDQHTSRFSIQFHGTRGTLACPGRDYEKAGGNTCCFEVNCGKRLLVLDAGSGIKNLGERLVKDRSHSELDLLLTHGHYDHVEGLPFFAPLYCDNFTVNIWAGPLEGCSDARDLVGKIMSQPCFPVGTEVFRARVNYLDIDLHQSLALGDDILVHTAPMNHPGGATGFRIEYAGKVFSLITDTEHVPGQTDENVLKLAQNADLFVYDATYVEAEMAEYRGYGHSSWEEAERICRLAGAERVLACHHSPFRTDAEIDQIESRFLAKNSPISTAREGMILEL